MRDRLAAICLLCCLWLVPGGAAIAVPVEGLYEAMVSGESTEAGRGPAAAEALRQVVVRVTGRASAATDPVLQGVYAEATKYAQTYRSIAPGQIAVAFEPALVEAALAKAGQKLWGRERPQFLVILDGASPAQSIAKREMQASAQNRGLPLIFADSRADPPAAVRDGGADALKAVGRTFGTDGVLLLRLTGSGASAMWVGPAGDGTASGSPSDILDALADRLGNTLAQSLAENGRIVVVVHGVQDLPGFVGTLSELGRLPMVRGVALESVMASTVRLRVSASADAAALRKAVRDAGHFDVGEGGGPREIDLVYHP